MLALACAFVICASVKHILAFRAVLADGLIGLALYGINVAVVSVAFPDLVRMERRVIFTHIVFGLICASLYKGLVPRPLPPPNSAA